MDLSQIKLVITDLNGTLLNSNHKVSSLFFELFKVLKKHHILFVAASGRSYYSIIDKLDPMKIDTIIDAENGGIVIEKGELILSTPMCKKSLLDMKSLINSDANIHPIYCTKSKAYFSDSSSKEYINTLLEY